MMTTKKPTPTPPPSSPTPSHPPSHHPPPNSRKPSTATASSSSSISSGPHRFRDRKGFLNRWLRHTWLDLLILLLVAGLTIGLHFTPIPFRRYFPVTYLHSGDVVYPELAYPEQDCTVPEWLAAILALSIPILVFVGFKVRTRDPWDLSHAVFGVIWAVLIASLISILIRLFFGGFAPDFLSVCQPEHRDPYKSFDEAEAFDFDIDLREGLFDFEDRWSRELDGKGYQSIMHTSRVCTQRNRWKVRRAMMSFPSIHTVLYFSGFGFLFLWLNAKLKVWSDHKASFWKLMLVLLPLFLAIIFSGFLKAQNHNHWYDIVAGVIVGFGPAVAVFRLSYGGVFDWKHNHKPMDKNKPMEKNKPGMSNTIDKSGPVITRRAGWGAQSTTDGKEDVEASV